MLSLEIEYINGMSFASSPIDKKKAEWPPHPDRLFSAFVASWGILKKDKEVQALQWLESQKLPDVLFPDVNYRDSVITFVPVSGKPGKTNHISQNYPIFEVIKHIVRKERFFPTVILPNNNHIAYMIWNDAKPSKEIFDVLVNLTSRISNIGHSASLVRVSVNSKDHSSDHRYVPDNNGHIFLRCPYKGRFEELRRAYESHSNTTWHPNISPTHRYAELGNIPIKSSMGDDWVILTFKSDFIPSLESFPILAKKMRDIIMSRAEQPVHEIISGHSKDGKPLQKPHLAIIPLANVGWKFSDGRLMGIALVLPRDSKYGTDERRQLVKTVTRFLDGGGSLKINEIEIKLKKDDDDDRFSLQPDRYITESKTWTSVTPIILDRHPKKRQGKTIQDIITNSCVNIGLPKPIDIKISRYSNVNKSPPAYPSSQSNRIGGWKSQKPQSINNQSMCHAVITFETKVCGPIIIGAGRYYGLGLCMCHEK